MCSKESQRWAIPWSHRKNGLWGPAWDTASILTLTPRAGFLAPAKHSTTGTRVGGGEGHSATRSHWSSYGPRPGSPRSCGQADSPAAPGKSEVFARPQTSLTPDMAKMRESQKTGRGLACSEVAQGWGQDRQGSNFQVTRYASWNLFFLGESYRPGNQEA